MKRQDGYYWVKNDTGGTIQRFVWSVEQWLDGFWQLGGEEYGDSEFVEINENRIPSPDEKGDMVMGVATEDCKKGQITCFIVRGEINQLPPVTFADGVVVRASTKWEFQDTSTPRKDQ